MLLRPDPDSYAASRPINEGLELIMMLEKFPTSQVTVVCNTDSTLTEAAYFMRMNGLPKAQVVFTAVEDKDERPALSQWHAINRLRARGPINLVVTSYREVYERCTQSHQAVLLFGRTGALSSMVEEHPAWEDLHARVLATKEARLADETEDYSNRSEGF